ncbi:hypothetical protein PU629_06375 [Pullulanibacillus sp. KACC 23026]|uniref:hypothetical protein n=1 Tax=Pullulanibacillus sp. KACC 23026 TaxID=3028315 RepID=UPI0023AE8541|nr:hypothetical protein [Pullulanibacillus sp. KACC 23026]WEG13990.1 hypothetical protein PU629_06375 [Pullulanibacillus sp. KACC 23026]
MGKYQYIPMGIKSKKIWEIEVKEERLKVLLGAIKRWEKAGLEIPSEWDNEYLDLTLDLELYKK